MKHIYAIVQETEDDLQVGSMVEVQTDEQWGLDEFIHFSSDLKIIVKFNGEMKSVTKQNLRNFWIFDDLKGQ